VRLGRQVVYYIIQGVIIQSVVIQSVVIQGVIIKVLAIGIYDFHVTVLIKSVGYKEKKITEYLE
jgi:hypothetical protein